MDLAIEVVVCAFVVCLCFSPFLFSKKSHGNRIGGKGIDPRGKPELERAETWGRDAAMGSLKLGRFESFQGNVYDAFRQVRHCPYFQNCVTREQQIVYGVAYFGIMHDYKAGKIHINKNAGGGTETEPVTAPWGQGIEATIGYPAITDEPYFPQSTVASPTAVLPKFTNDAEAAKAQAYHDQMVNAPARGTPVENNGSLARNFFGFPISTQHVEHEDVSNHHGR